MLELKNIKYSVTDANGQAVDILNNVSLKFDKGITVITGQNGSGKNMPPYLVVYISFSATC